MKAIKTKTEVRSATPKHFGRRSAEEQVALEAQRKIHLARDLPTMLRSTVPNFHLYENDVLKTIKHWLMDCAHERRMEGQVNDQDVIERLIETLEVG